MQQPDLTDVSTHFAFGRNWADYANSVGDAQIRDAEAGLRRLVAIEDLRQRTFLDIGCGSGIHALAALRMGVSRVYATDVDVDSVTTTTALLTKHAQGANWQAVKLSVFGLDPKQHGQFDVVYSWGVLHHTGNMRLAVEKAAQMVSANGLLALALYRKTLLCPFWAREKRFYSKASPRVQSAIRTAFLGVRKAIRGIRGRSTTSDRRGMDLAHDAHDWLGGYPYESITPATLQAWLAEFGFEPVKIVARRQPQLGLLGSGCDEFVFRRG